MRMFEAIAQMMMGEFARRAEVDKSNYDNLRDKVVEGTANLPNDVIEGIQQYMRARPWDGFRTVDEVSGVEGKINETPHLKHDGAREYMFPK